MRCEGTQRLPRRLDQSTSARYPGGTRRKGGASHAQWRGDVLSAGARHRDVVRRDRRGHRARAHPARRCGRLVGGGARAVRGRRTRGRVACSPRGDGADDPARVRDRSGVPRGRRRDRGHGWSRACRCLAGRGRRREVSGARPREAVVRREPPRRPRGRRPARARAATRPVPGDARLRWALVPAPGRGRDHVRRADGLDHRRRSGRGLRQGRPAARPAVPRRAAHRPRRVVGFVGRDRLPAWAVLPARPRAPPVRLLLLRAEDRGGTLGAGARSVRRPGARSPTSRRPSRRRCATCSPARRSTQPSPRASRTS